MRGPDGVAKNHPSKQLLKWYRRCIVLSAFDKKTLDNPYHEGGGSYTGPSIEEVAAPVTVIEYVNPNTGQFVILERDWETPMNKVLRSYIDSQDSLPFHFYLHVLHAIEIVGYKHSNARIRKWWFLAYDLMCRDLHLFQETETELNARLNDDEKTWKADNTRCTSAKK